LAAARESFRPRSEIIAACATERRIEPAALATALFADLPGERLAMPPAILDLGELALRSNLLIAQALMARAFTVQISLEGNSRAVVTPRSGDSSAP
jgi:predicted nuclease of restriction endonuclease-like RecB superfamily